ncbi:MAG: translocation/assembly module TamB domain-containing protein, partial [Candidatus Latescibacteria bacterium]|nr:translocation/assembly module TamB domain-containing protein [Candidatus Latescibacterota bacterium]
GPIQLTYSPTKGVQIDHFSIAGPAGRIEAQDQTDFQATIGVVLTELDLKPWAFLMGVSGMSGVLNGEIDLAGTLSDPLVFGTFTLIDGLFYGVRVNEADGELSFGDGRALVEAHLIPNSGESLDVVGSFSVKNDGDVQLRARSDGVELSTLDTLWAGVAEMKGVLSLDVEIRGRFANPDLQGQLALENGVLKVSSLKRSFSPVSAQVSIADGQVHIDTLAFGKNAGVQGVMSLEGFVPRSWNLAARLSDFEPVAWPELRLRTDGRLQLTGTIEAPELTGELLMKQADIRLADLLASPEDIWESSGFLKALDMRVEVAADRQVWVRDPTFNAEITGDVDVIKDKEGLRMYGAMQSRRGNYILQNRRLRIEQGDIQFQGRTEVNPDLNIRAQTQVRAVAGNEREPVTVRVTVGGTLSHPQVEMTSDPLFSELDIVALLVTGRASGAFDFSGGDAMTVMLGFAANRLGQRIGQELNLDLVEVDIGQANISRIRVGKYLGPRLFVSYAQDISTTARDVAMEFEVLPGLTVEGLHAEEVDEETNNSRRRQSLGLFWKKEW